MGNTKARFSFLTALIIAPALIAGACGSDDGDDAAATATTVTAATAATATTAGTGEAAAGSADYEQYLGNPSSDQCAGRSYDFGFDIFSDTESFALATVNGFQAVADTMGCVNIDVASDDLDPLRAVENVEIFAAQGKDGVIIANVIEAAGPGIVDVLQRNDLDGLAIFVAAPGVTLIEVDLGNAGLRAGEALASAAAAWAGEDIHLIVGTFDEAGQTTIDLTDGIVEGVTAVFPDAQVIPIVTAADPPTANANTAAVLAMVPEGGKVLVASVNDELTLAMFEALRTAGHSGDNILAVGQGASQLGSVCDGTLHGSVAYFPENYGKYAIPALIGQINGAVLPGFIELPTQVLTADNVGDFYPESACG
jgi:hypothetical protein